MRFKTNNTEVVEYDFVKLHYEKCEGETIKIIYYSFYKRAQHSTLSNIIFSILKFIP